jgi:hypothetical protein
MSNLPPSDYNMPPGVRTSDIPGNRPGDDECICEHCLEVMSARDVMLYDNDPECACLCSACRDKILG